MRNKLFTSPSKAYRQSSFKTTTRPHSPSPKKVDYQRKAKTRDDKKSKCTYIHPDTGKRCKNLLGLYPQFCELHTLMIHNVFIAKSNITMAGNGLFAGPHGFKRGSLIGKYNFDWNSVPLGTLEKRCKNEKCWDYVFCEEGNDKNTKCWDGLDIRSTLMRNINDAHNSKFRNNSHFEMINNDVYVVASRSIKPYKEILVDYGRNYWN